MIEYEDDLTFGELENIVNQSVDLSDVAKPKVNIPSYRMNILTKVLKKSKFFVKRKSIKSLRNNGKFKRRSN